jgi:hypothetical protein
MARIKLDVMDPRMNARSRGTRAPAKEGAVNRLTNTSAKRPSEASPQTDESCSSHQQAEQQSLS